MKAAATRRVGDEGRVVIDSRGQRRRAEPRQPHRWHSSVRCCVHSACGRPGCCNLETETAGPERDQVKALPPLTGQVDNAGIAPYEDQ